MFSGDIRDSRGILPRVYTVRINNDRRNTTTSITAHGKVEDSLDHREITEREFASHRYKGGPS